jgi:hypothetical protein
MEDAITMLVSGGAIIPDGFSLSSGAKLPDSVQNPATPPTTAPIAPED